MQKMNNIGLKNENEVNQISNLLDENHQKNLLDNTILIDFASVENFFEQQRKAMNNIMSVFTQIYMTHKNSTEPIDDFEEFLLTFMNNVNINSCNYRLLSNGTQSYDTLNQKIKGYLNDDLINNIFELFTKTVGNYESVLTKLKDSVENQQGNHKNNKKSDEHSMGQSFNNLNNQNVLGSNLKKKESHIGNKPGTSNEQRDIEKSQQQKSRTISQQNITYSSNTMNSFVDALKNLNQFFYPSSVKFNLQQLQTGTSIIFSEFLKGKLLTKSLLKGEDKEAGVSTIEDLEKTFRQYYEEIESLKQSVRNKDFEVTEKDKIIEELIEKIESFHTDEIIAANKQMIDNRKLFLEKGTLNEEALVEKDKELKKSVNFTSNLQKKVQELRESINILRKRNRNFSKKEMKDKETQVFHKTTVDHRQFTRHSKKATTEIGLSNLIVTNDVGIEMNRLVCDSVTNLFHNFVYQNSQTNTFANVLNQYNLTNDIFNYNDISNMAQNHVFTVKNMSQTVSNVAANKNPEKPKEIAGNENNSKASGSKSPLKQNKALNKSPTKSVNRKATNSAKPQVNQFTFEIDIENFDTLQTTSREGEKSIEKNMTKPNKNCSLALDTINIEKGPLLKYFIINPKNTGGVQLTKLFGQLFNGFHALSDQFLKEFIYNVKQESKHSARYSLLKKMIIGKEKNELINETSTSDKINNSTNKMAQNILYELDAPRLFLIIRELCKDKLTNWTSKNVFLPTDFSKEVIMSSEDCREIICKVFEAEFGVDTKQFTQVVHTILTNCMKISKQKMTDNPAYLNEKISRNDQPSTPVGGGKNILNLLGMKGNSPARSRKKESPLKKGNARKNLNIEDKVQFDILAEEQIELVILNKVIGLEKYFTEMTVQLKVNNNFQLTTIKRSFGMLLLDPYYTLHSINKKPERSTLSNLDPLLNYFSLEIMQVLKHEDPSSILHLNQAYLTFIPLILQALECSKIIIANDRLRDMVSSDLKNNDEIQKFTSSFKMTSEPHPITKQTVGNNPNNINVEFSMTPFTDQNDNNLVRVATEKRNINLTTKKDLFDGKDIQDKLKSIPFFVKPKYQYFHDYDIQSTLDFIHYVYQRFNVQIFAMEELPVELRSGMMNQKVFLQENSPEKFEDETFKEIMMLNLEDFCHNTFKLFKDLLESIELSYRKFTIK